MSAAAPDLFGRLQQQRSRVVQGFLWILLAVVAGTFAANALLLGPRVLTPTAFLPNLVFGALVGTALWLNRRQRYRVAVGIVVGVTYLSAAFPVASVGFVGNEIVLFLFFAPLVLAGLLLGRGALYLTAASTLLVVLLAPALHGADVRMGDDLASNDAWLVALQFAIVFATITFFLDRFGVTFQNTLRIAVEHEISLGRETRERQRTAEALLEERQLNEAIIEDLPGVFFVIDESGSYVQWNRNFARVLGYDADDMRHLKPTDLFERGERDLVESKIAEVFAEGRSTMEGTLLTKEGGRIPFLLNGTRVELDGAARLVGIGVDRSEVDAAQARIRTLNEDLQERLDRITALHEIDKAITGGMDLDGTLDVVLKQITERLRVDAASILLYKPSTHTLRYGAGRGFSGTTLQRTELRLGEGLAGRAGLERERIVIDDPTAFEAAFRDASNVPREGFRTYVAVPLVAKGKLQGVLELFHRGPLGTSDEWDAFLTTLATQAAIALDDTRMLRDLERSNAELRLAYDTTIEGWGRALDLRDEETEGHSRRVTELTVRLAERVGLRDADLVHVRRGALLHDIGKMGVPDRILLKPGKLNEEEWAAMKEHPGLAYELLSPIAFLHEALAIPYAHHERWDGTGYPRGLKGEAIPLAARLFAVVDVYDALTSDRPYRAAWSEAKALDHIREGAGSHFDPAVVEAFLGMMQAEPRAVATPA